MEHMLLDRELMGYVDGSITLDPAAEEPAPTVFKRKSQKALTAIVMAIGDTPASVIRCCKSPADAWNRLVNKYEKNTMTGKLHLCQRFFTMKMPEGSNAEKHMREMKDISDRLTALGSPLCEDYEIMVLLLSLPTSYSSLVTSLGVNTDKLKLEEVHSAILDLELRLQGQVSDVGNDAALVGATGRVDNSKSTYRCYTCNNFGHIESTQVRIHVYGR